MPLTNRQGICRDPHPCGWPHGRSRSRHTTQSAGRLGVVMSVGIIQSRLKSPHVALCVCIVFCGQGTHAVGQSQDSKISFQSQVLPVLKRNCLKCHGVSKKEGKLQLHSTVRIWNGGESGPAVVASQPSESLLSGSTKPTAVSRKTESPPGGPVPGKHRIDSTNRELRNCCTHADISSKTAGLVGRDC